MTKSHRKSTKVVFWVIVLALLPVLAVIKKAAVAVNGSQPAIPATTQSVALGKNLAAVQPQFCLVAVFSTGRPRYYQS